MSATGEQARPSLTDPFEIGGVPIANRVLLAPLAGTSEKAVQQAIVEALVNRTSEEARMILERLKDSSHPQVSYWAKEGLRKYEMSKD